MSNLAQIERRCARLQEIGSILSAMKNLSLVESRKLVRFIGQQQQMLANILAAGADFLQFFPGQRDTAPSHLIVLLIGSERGFCGNFNERVRATFAALPEQEPLPWLISVGHRLESKLSGHPRLLATLDGATAAEEVPATLDQLMMAIEAARNRLAGGSIALEAVAWEADAEPSLHHILPMPEGGQSQVYPPLLYLPPAEFFQALSEQYLLASFYGLLYGSLAAESRRRVEHMESALDRLDEITARLNIKRNALRQEEIVEEIEVILSGAQATI